MQSNQQNNVPEEQPTPEKPTPEKRRPLTEMERAQLIKRRDNLLKRRVQEIRDATTQEEKNEIYKAVHFERKTTLKPTTVRGKWENYWYHYKFLTFGAIFAAILVTIFVHDMVTKTKYDMNMMLLSCQTYMANEDATGEMEKKIAEYMTDLNDDGLKNIYLETISIDRNNMDAIDPNVMMAQTTKMQVAMSEASTLIYLMDQTYYDYFKENELKFVDLAQYSDNPNIDGDRYAIKDDSEFSTLEGKDDLFLVIRDLETVNKGDKPETVERFNRELEIVKKIIQE